MGEETAAEWAARMVRERTMLLHPETGVVDVPAEYFDGVDHCYVSGVNESKVAAPVLLFASGHALLADPQKFVELNAIEKHFALAAKAMVDNWVARGIDYAASLEIPPRSASHVLSLLLRETSERLKAKYVQLEEPQ